MSHKNLLSVLSVLQEFGLDLAVPHELRKKAQDAHDEMGFLLGLWDETCRPMRARQIVVDSIKASYANKQTRAASVRLNQIMDLVPNVDATIDGIESRAAKYGISLNQPLSKIEEQIAEREAAERGTPSEF